MIYFIIHEGQRYRVSVPAGRVKSVRRVTEKYMPYGPNIHDGPAFDAAVDDYARIASGAVPLDILPPSYAHGD